MIRPDYKEFSRLAREATLVPVVKSVMADLLTPVSASLAIFRGEENAFLLESVERGEKIGEHTKDDLHLPDCVLMFFDRLLAFDHLRHQIHIIAVADVSGETPRKAYDRAITDIEALERKLAGGLRSAGWNNGPGNSRGKLKVNSVTPQRKFEQSVETAKEYIAAGDIFQVVLSQRLDFKPDV